MYVSTTADITSKINIITENNVCLIISNLIFSLLLSFIIDLYTFIPVTAKASNAGIKIIFCINKLHVANIVPFYIPNVATAEDIVYPIQNPLKDTMPNTIGNPIIVEPANHIIIVRITLSFIEFFISSILSIL